MVTDFSVAEKDRGAKFCMRVDLLSWQVYSPSGEHYWLTGNHGAGITLALFLGCMRPGTSAAPPLPVCVDWEGLVRIRNWERQHCLRPYCGIYVLQACWRTCFYFLFFPLWAVCKTQL